MNKTKINRNLYWGVGYEGTGKYKVYNGRAKTKAGLAWTGMLRRCYDSEYKEERKSYDGCCVARGWHDFQNFANWFYRQKASEIECHLDKDILFPGNKEYSATTCCLVPPSLNKTFIRFEGSFGVEKLPSGNFRARVRNKSDVIRKCFRTVKEARNFYLKSKREVILQEIENFQEFIDDRILNRFKDKKHESQSNYR